MKCNISASTIELLIDWSVNPCDSFYDYACGRFVKDTTLHERKDLWKIIKYFLNHRRHKLKEQLQRLLTADLYPVEIRAFQMTKQLYKSCINTELSDHTGAEALLDILNEMRSLFLLKGAHWNDNN